MNLICTFTDDHSLTFKLRDIPLVKKFAKLIRKCNQLGYEPGYISTGLYHTLDDLEYLSNILRTCVMNHNSNDSIEQRIQFDYSQCHDITHKGLNILHDVYEQNMSQHEGVEKLLAGKNYKPTVEYITNLNHINNTIHMLEKNISTVAVGEFYEGQITSCLVSGTGEGDAGRFIFEIDKYNFNGDVLSKEDRQEFTLSRDFGDLFLGYSTTGKSLMHCKWSNDVSLVKDKKVASQQKFNTNICIKFPMERREHDIEYGYFKKWYDKNCISQYGYTADVATEGIGYLHIGRLIEHNNTAIDFYSMNKEQRLEFVNKIKRCTLTGYDVNVNMCGWCNHDHEQA